MKITMNGYYGFANYGDELFNLAVALGAARWWDGHDVDILGPPVAGVDAKFRVPGWFPSGLYTSPGLAGKLSRLGFFSGALLQSNLIVHAGGSTLTSARTIRKKIERFAASRGFKFAAIGVSVGPFADAGDEADAAALLRKFIHFSVRDRKSVELLEKMGVPVKPLLGRDLAGVLPLLLPEPPPGVAQRETGRAVLGISVCHFERLHDGDTAREDRRNAAIFDGVSRFAKREGVLVRIFSLNNHAVSGDGALSAEFQRRMQRDGVEAEIVSARDNLLGCWHGIGACQAVLSVRLHGAITAYLCGVPFALVEYERKCADLVEDIGQPEELRIRADCTDPLSVEQIVARLFQRAELPSMSRDMYAREAALNFTEVPWAVATA